MIGLEPCPMCSRHVRTDVASCPFCAAAMPEAFHARPVPVPPPAGLDRAGQARFRAAGYATIAACALASTAALAACSNAVASYGAVVPFEGLDSGFPSGVVAGGACEGPVYVVAADGSYAYCHNGTWETTVTLPQRDGGYARIDWDGAADSGDASSSDASGSSSATSGTSGTSGAGADASASARSSSSGPRSSSAK